MIDIRLISVLSLVAAATVGAVGLYGEEDSYKIIVNYNGQADLLLSLQIPPDYYPYQFKKNSLYDYLTHVNKYLVVNSDTSNKKKKIGEGFQSKINHLLGKVKEFGPSLGNEDLYDTGIVFRNDQFGSRKKTSLMFIEQFISDDYTNINNSLGLLPAHKDLIVTNYRAARDPYTVFDKNVFECFKSSSNDSCKDEVGQKFKKYMEKYKLTDINSLYRFGKYMEFGNKLQENSKDQLEKLGFNNLLKEDKLFSLNEQEDSALFKKYKYTLFTHEEQEEMKNGKQDFQMNYEKSNLKLVHHPALEQQIMPGTAPLAEGSQKDIVVFLYQFAALIDKYTKGANFQTEFKNDYRKEKMEKALDNSQAMAKNISERIKNIREYFKKIKVVDEKFDPDKKQYSVEGSKTFTVLTYPPASFGAGDATIQSMSKFPFIYQDIGLKQPVPNNLLENHEDDNHEENLEEGAFSVDDNGWGGKIGNVNLDPGNMMKFRDTTDTLLILANEDDGNLLNDVNSNTLKAAGILLKGEDKCIDARKINVPGYEVSYNRYHLWNEGLRSPIALNLLLDNLVDIFQKQYDGNRSIGKNEYSKAMDWGDYWENNFLS